MRTLRRLSVVILLAVLLGNVPVWADAPAQERITLTYGQTVTGFLDDTSFFQQYSFEGAAGDAVIITMDRDNGNLDPLLLLGDASLNLIAEDDDGGSEFNARLELILPADGTYVIEATRYGQQQPGLGGTGGYRLTILANEVGGSGGVRRGGLLSQLDFGGTERGLLNAADAFHLFWFQAQAGDEITAQSALGGGVSATLSLYDDRFNLLTSDPVGEAVTSDLERPGVYFVALARNPESSDGTYALTLSGNVALEEALPDLPPVPLSYGQRIQGVITDPRPVERYVFSGAANDQVLLRMEALGSDLDAFIYLYGPNGEIIGQDDDSGGNRNAELAVVLPLAGEYTALATRFGRENGPTSGAYALSLSQGTVPVELEDITPDTEPPAGDGLPANFIGLPQVHYGDTVGGTVDAQGYYQFYVFEAAAGDQISISMTQASGNLDTFIQLLNASTETIAQNDDVSANDTDSRLEFTIPQDGYYAIFATRFEVEAGVTTGDYVLSLNATAVARTTGVIDLLPAEELPPGATVNGQLEQNVASLYRFTAAAGDTIELSLDVNDLLQPEVVLALLDADLNEVAVSFDGRLTHVMTQSGAYLALVTRRSGPLSEAGGIFALSLSGTTPFTPATPIPVAESPDGEPATTDAGEETPETDVLAAAPTGDTLAYGQVVTGDLSDEREEYEYTFAAQTGDRISIILDSIDATLDPLLLVLDPEGNQIIRDDNGGGNFNARVDAYLITASGQYTLIATRTQGRGTFQLTLQGIPVSQPTLDTEGRRILTLGQTVSGQISDDAAATIYAFQATAGEVVQIAMTTASGDLDPYVALLDAGQNMLAQDDDSGGNRNARLVYSVVTSGWHYIVATRFEFAAGITSGEYLLSLTSD